MDILFMDESVKGRRQWRRDGGFQLKVESMLSQTAEYALRAIVHVAQNYDTPQTALEIAEKTKVPKGYLSKIMQAMAKNGLVKSQRGFGGGFVLTRHPKHITVLDVLKMADSPIQRIVDCPLGIESHQALCPVHKMLDEAMRHIEERFEGTTLEELLNSAGGSTPLCAEEFSV